MLVAVFAVVVVGRKVSRANLGWLGARYGNDDGHRERVSRGTTSSSIITIIIEACCWDNGNGGGSRHHLAIPTVSGRVRCNPILRAEVNMTPLCIRVSTLLSCFPWFFPGSEHSFEGFIYFSRPHYISVFVLGPWRKLGGLLAFACLVSLAFAVSCRHLRTDTQNKRERDSARRELAFLGRDHHHHHWDLGISRLPTINPPPLLPLPHYRRGFLLISIPTVVPFPNTRPLPYPQKPLCFRFAGQLST